MRLTDERDYLVHGNIQLPIFDSESEYIDYLEKEDIIDPFLAGVLRKLVGYKPERMIIDEVSLNNVLLLVILEVQKEQQVLKMHLNL